MKITLIQPAMRGLSVPDPVREAADHPVEAAR